MSVLDGRVQDQGKTYADGTPYLSLVINKSEAGVLMPPTPNGRLPIHLKVAGVEYLTEVQSSDLPCLYLSKKLFTLGGERSFLGRVLTDAGFHANDAVRLEIEGHTVTVFRRNRPSGPTGREAAVEGKLPEEAALVEGAVCQVTVNAYERNREARERCLEEHGTDCSVCGFSFGATYGKDAEGYIHVHHLVPLSMRGGEHQVDGAADLTPVCPNCHAVIHLGGGCRGIEEVKSMIAHKAVRADVTDDALSVDLSDGRSFSVPIGWYPRLANGTAEERAGWQLVGGGSGLHWAALDEDVSVASLLAGRRSAESQRSLQRWLAGRGVVPSVRQPE